MANATASSSSGGIGFCGLLTIVFIVLKLTGFIDWSWLWVLAPLWLPLCLVLAVMVFVGIIALIVMGIAMLSDGKKSKKSRRIR